MFLYVFHEDMPADEIEPALSLEDKLQSAFLS